MHAQMQHIRRCSRFLPSRLPFFNKILTEKFKYKSWFNKDNVTISLQKLVNLPTNCYFLFFPQIQFWVVQKCSSRTPVQTASAWLVGRIHIAGLSSTHLVPAAPSITLDPNVFMVASTAECHLHFGGNPETCGRWVLRPEHHSNKETVLNRINKTQRSAALQWPDEVQGLSLTGDVALN